MKIVGNAAAEEFDDPSLAKTEISRKRHVDLPTEEPALVPLVPEDRFNSDVARRCLDSGTIVIGEVKEEYASHLRCDVSVANKEAVCAWCGYLFEYPETRFDLVLVNVVFCSSRCAREEARYRRRGAIKFHYREE